MTQLHERKRVNWLALVFALTYMVSYITRINYGAIVSELERATHISKSLLSMAPTGSFITYGIGQVVSGICGDRFSSKKLIAGGLLLSTLMNLLIPICQNIYQILAVWCVNGFAQAFLWPPMVRLMVTLLSEDDYKRVSVKVSWGSSAGTIAVYLLSPLLISLFSWKAVFVFSASCGILMALFWVRFPYEPAANKLPDPVKKEPGHTGGLFTPLLLCVMIAIVFQGMLRDGVTTWMPSYIAETYHLSTSISILTGVALPIFSIISYYAAEKMYQKAFPNPLMCSGVIFGAGAVSALALVCLSGQNAGFSVLFSALLTGCMHGVNIILICMVPPFFKDRGKISTISGILNSCTYIGSALSTYGIAFLSERFGWQFTLWAWLLVGTAGTLVCLLSAKPWAKRFMQRRG